MAGDESSTAVFEFCDVGPNGPRRDVLGLWAPVRLSTPGGERSDLPQGAVPFASPARVGGEPSASAGEAPVWRASYPADREQIAVQLRYAEQKLEASQAALAVAPDRLDAFLARGPVALAYSFATPGAGLARPESELSLLLFAGAQRERVVSYDLEGQFAARWASALEALRAFAGQLLQISAGFAWVETRVAQAPVGWTRVTWAGDVHSVVTTRLAADRIRLHQRTLDLALDSRRTTLRMSGLILAGAAKLVTMLSTGLGVVAAVPAVLRFIEQLRIEYEEHQQRKEEGAHV